MSWNKTEQTEKWYILRTEEDVPFFGIWIIFPTAGNTCLLPEDLKSQECAGIFSKISAKAEAA
ncbi:MAG: hypothetical protein IJG15_00595 [Lachnospiraceae bacterium]|nr:hypothetical protein [Lachnospiraceae bacterium]